MSWEGIVLKSKWWHKLVDEIMLDGKPRTSEQIKLIIREGLYERKRVGRYLPSSRSIGHYLKSTGKYIKGVVKGHTKLKTWQLEG